MKSTKLFPTLLHVAHSIFSPFFFRDMDGQGGAGGGGLRVGVSATAGVAHVVVVGLMHMSNFSFSPAF